jgi:hypothetical protein
MVQEKISILFAIGIIYDIFGMIFFITFIITSNSGKPYLASICQIL